MVVIRRNRNIPGIPEIEFPDYRTIPFDNPITKARIAFDSENRRFSLGA